MRFRKLQATIAGMALAVTLSACGGGAGTSAAAGGGEINPAGELVLGSITVPTGLDPHKELQGGERPYWFLVYDRLTQMNSEGEIVPMLATSWKTSPDGKQVTFQLRDDVTFNDGEKFDAQAVKTNVQRAKTVDGTMVDSDLAIVKSVKVKTPTEVTFTLSRPDAEFPGLLAGPAGAQISPAAIASGVDLSKDPGTAGSGPYVVDSFTPNEGAVFVPADDDYWDKKAGHLKRLELKFIPDEQALVSALRAGELDAGYINPFRAASIQEAEQLAESGPMEMKEAPTGVVNALLLNVARIDDPKIRQALIRSIDTKAISEDLMQGTCEETNQISREGFAGYVDGYESPYSYDQAAAKKLLADAGEPDLQTSIGFIAGREQIPAVLQQQLAETGVDAELNPLSSVEVLSAWRSDGLDAWNFQFSPELSFSSTMEQLLGSTGVHLEDPAIEAAVRKAVAIKDDTARAEAEGRVMQQVMEKAVMVPYCHFDAHWLVAEDVTGFEEGMLPYAQFMVDLRHVARTE